MVKVVLPICYGSADEYYGPWPCGRDGADVQMEALVKLANLSGELAELLRELSNAKWLTFHDLENRVGAAIERFDAIAEVKR